MAKPISELRAKMSNQAIAGAKRRARNMHNKMLFDLVKQISENLDELANMIPVKHELTWRLRDITQSVNEFDINLKGFLKENV